MTDLILMQVQEIFMCSLCSEEFDFGYRAKHLNGPSHRLKFLVSLNTTKQDISSH